MRRIVVDPFGNRLRQTARRIDLARKDVADRRAALAAGVPRPEDGVHGRVVRQRFQIEDVTAAAERDDALEAGGLDLRERGALGVRERIGVVRGIFALQRVADNDEHGRFAAGGVDRETGFGEPVRQRDAADGVDAGRATSARLQAVRRAEQRKGRTGRERQRAVVLEQHEALGGGAARQRGMSVEPVERNLDETRVREHVVGAVAEQHRSVVQRLDRRVAEPAVRIVLDHPDAVPGAPVVGGERRGKRRAPAVRPHVFRRTVRLHFGARAVIVPERQQVARRQTLDARRGQRRDERRGRGFAPCVAAVGRTAEILATGVRADPEEHAPVRAFHDARLLGGKGAAVRAAHGENAAAASPCRAVVVGRIRQDGAGVVELAVRERVLRHGEEEPPVAQLDDAVVVEDVVGDLVGDARDRLAPGAPFVERAAQDGTAVGERILDEIKERDLAALEPQEADAHHVHPARIADDDLVRVGPGGAVVGRIPRGDLGGGVVRLGFAAVARVREQDPSVPERQERAFAVARVAGAGRQVKRPDDTGRGTGQHFQHDLADRARCAVGQAGRVTAVRREEGREFARADVEALAGGAPQDDVAVRQEALRRFPRRNHRPQRLRPGQRHMHVDVRMVRLEEIVVGPRLERGVEHVRPAVRAVDFVAARRKGVQIGTVQKRERLFKVRIEREEPRRLGHGRDDDGRTRVRRGDRPCGKSRERKRERERESASRHCLSFR